MGKPRLYILGDSFAANLFKEPWLKNGTEIFDYKIEFESAHKNELKWWTDYLQEWSNYEVINLGMGGCSYEDIYYQFSEIDEYREGDRLIVHWTNPYRFNYYNNKSVHAANPDYLDNLTITDEEKEFVLDIFGAKKCLWSKNDGERIRNFVKYLYQIHKKYKPIFFSVFAENYIYMREEPYFFSLNLFLKSECQISVESLSKYKDGHWGYVGNYRVALFMLCKLVYGNIPLEEQMKIIDYFPKPGGLKDLKIYEDYISKYFNKFI